MEICLTAMIMKGHCPHLTDGIVAQKNDIFFFRVTLQIKWWPLKRYIHVLNPRTCQLLPYIAKDVIKDLERKNLF